MQCLLQATVDQAAWLRRLLVGNCKELTTRYAGCDGCMGASNGTRQKQSFFC